MSTTSSQFSRTIHLPGIFFGLAALCMAPIAESAPAEPDADSHRWAVMEVSGEAGNENEDRGLMLFTVSVEQAGAAFRCENGRLFAYLSTRPLDFRRQLDYPYSNARNREVSYAIGDAAEATGIWVQMYRGRVYLVTEVSASVGIFEAAARGESVSFTRKYQDPLYIELPVIGQAVLEQFLGRCELNPDHRPTLAGNETPAAPPA